MFGIPQADGNQRQGSRKKREPHGPNAPEICKGSPSFTEKQGPHVKRKTPKCQTMSLRTRMAAEPPQAWQIPEF